MGEHDGTPSSQLVMVVRYEDLTRPDTGTVADLAEVLRHRAYGDVHIEVLRLQALDKDDQLVDVTYQVEGAGEYDENHYAHPKVTVLFPDGHEEFAFYTIDGAA